MKTHVKKNFLEKLRQQNKEYDEWQNSQEGVLYDLKTLGDFMVADDKDKRLIAEVMLKLPKGVKQKVLDKVTFIIMRANGCCISPIIQHRVKAKDLHKVDGLGFDYVVKTELPLIILNFPAMRKQSKSSKMSVIAHEIAHFALKHYEGNKISNPSNEKEADDLIVKWGFKRSYKSYKWTTCRE